jgi:hypothetical protein
MSEPTKAQIDAGNYPKGHEAWNGLRLAFENRKGTVRKGVDGSGKHWHIKMPHDYGYVNGTEGRDGDQVDLFMGPKPNSFMVYVVNQRKLKGGFDEHKCMAGFHTKAEAVEAYDAAYQKGLGKKLRMGVKTMTVPQFKEWLADKGATQKKAQYVYDPAKGNAAAGAGLMAGEAIRKPSVTEARPKIETLSKGQIRDSLANASKDPNALPKPSLGQRIGSGVGKAVTAVKNKAVSATDRIKSVFSKPEAEAKPKAKPKAKAEAKPKAKAEPSAGKGNRVDVPKDAFKPKPKAAPAPAKPKAAPAPAKPKAVTGRSAARAANDIASGKRMPSAAGPRVAALDAIRNPGASGAMPLPQTPGPIPRAMKPGIMDRSINAFSNQGATGALTKQRSASAIAKPATDALGKAFAPIGKALSQGGASVASALNQSGAVGKTVLRTGQLGGKALGATSRGLSKAAPWVQAGTNIYDAGRIFNNGSEAEANRYEEGLGDAGTASRMLSGYFRPVQAINATVNADKQLGKAMTDETAANQSSIATQDAIKARNRLAATGDLDALYAKGRYAKRWAGMNEGEKATARNIAMQRQKINATLPQNRKQEDVDALNNNIAMQQESINPTRDMGSKAAPAVQPQTPTASKPPEVTQAPKDDTATPPAQQTPAESAPQAQTPGQGAVTPEVRNYLQQGRMGGELQKGEARQTLQPGQMQSVIDAAPSSYMIGGANYGKPRPVVGSALSGAIDGKPSSVAQAPASKLTPQQEVNALPKTETPYDIAPAWDSSRAGQSMGDIQADIENQVHGNMQREQAFGGYLDTPEGIAASKAKYGLPPHQLSSDQHFAMKDDYYRRNPLPSSARPPAPAQAQAPVKPAAPAQAPVKAPVKPTAPTQAPAPAQAPVKAPVKPAAPAPAQPPAQAQAQPPVPAQPPAPQPMVGGALMGNLDNKPATTNLTSRVTGGLPAAAPQPKASPLTNAATTPALANSFVQFQKPTSGVPAITAAPPLKAPPVKAPAPVAPPVPKQSPLTNGATTPALANSFSQLQKPVSSVPSITAAPPVKAPALAPPVTPPAPKQSPLTNSMTTPALAGSMAQFQKPTSNVPTLSAAAPLKTPPAPAPVAPVMAPAPKQSPLTNAATTPALAGSLSQFQKTP